MSDMSAIRKRSRSTTQVKLTVASALIDAPQELQDTCSNLPDGASGVLYASFHDAGSVSLVLPWPDITILKSPIGQSIQGRLSHVAKHPEMGDGQLVVEASDGSVALETHSFSSKRHQFASWRTKKLERLVAEQGLASFVSGIGCSGDGKMVAAHLETVVDRQVMLCSSLFGTPFATTLLRLMKIARQIDVKAQLRVSDKTELFVSLAEVPWDSLLAICTTCDHLSDALFSELGHFAGAMGASQADDLQVRISADRISLAVGIDFNVDWIK